jgi:FKBP-type peptidyl-prolyl cis-trans isomerase FklB
MNKRLFALVTTGLLAGLVHAEDKVELKDQKAKVSYGIGMNLGGQWKRQDVDVDPELILKGIKDAMAGGATLMTETEVREVLTAFQREHQARQMEKRKQLGEKNKQEGAQFLAENKTKPGVITLPSGLQYKILTEGKGESPRSNDIVTVNYRGTLIDGTEFDSSTKNGQPLVRAANMLIKGWTEALQLMKPGAKWQLFIPAELAYGERGSGQQIAPNAALIFDVELISFKSPEPPPAAVAPAAAQPVTSDIIKVPSKEELEKGAKIEVIKKEDLEKLQKEAQEKKKQEAPKN